MTDEELGAAIRATIRSSPADARPLVSKLARRAAARKDVALRAEASFWKGEAELAAGNVGAAAKAYDAAWNHFGKSKGSPLKAATLLGRLQTHAQMGNTRGIPDMARTLRSLVSTPHHKAAVECAVGTSYNALGEDAQAEECFRSALRHLARQRGAAAAALRAKARHNLAIRLARRGHADSALKQLDLAAADLAKHGQSAWTDRILQNRAWVLGLQGRVPEALAAFDDVRARFEDAGNKRSAGIVLRDTAALLLRIGAAGRAAETARAAARLLPPVEAARARLLAARASTGAEAKRLARQAHKVFANAGDAVGTAMADIALGHATPKTAATLRHKGHWLASLDALLASDPTVAQLKRSLREYPPSVRRWLAPEIERRLARGADRIPRLRRAFRAAEELRLLAPTTVLRAQSLRTHRDVYKELAAALIERGRPRDLREAFLVIDALQARTLREQLDREAPALDAPELRRRLELVWRQIELDEEDGGDLRRTQRAPLAELRAIEEQMRDAFGAVPGQRTGASDSLPSFPVLSLVVLDTRVLTLCAEGGKVELVAEAPLGTVREVAAQFSFQVQRRLHGKVPEAIALGLLDRLGDLLLGGRWWNGPIGIVLPSELGEIPIEILPPLDGAEPFHLPWATVPARPRKVSGRPLVVGFGSQRLPEVAREVRDVKRRLQGAETLSGTKATRKAVLANLAARPLVHIAGHAAVDEQLPLLSGLRTADGWLTAVDLRDRALHGSVVVLSACRTGDPALRWEGEALAGFPRALLAGGASAILASRWEVRDVAARAWMSRFYACLGDGSLPRSLRRSMVEMRKEFPHPADWGAFILVSHGRPK